jgi:hypothetical protein
MVFFGQTYASWWEKKQVKQIQRIFLGKQMTQSHHIMKGETLASPNLGNKLQHVAKI